MLLIIWPGTGWQRRHNLKYWLIAGFKHYRHTPIKIGHIFFRGKALVWQLNQVIEFESLVTATPPIFYDRISSPSSPFEYFHELDLKVAWAWMKPLSRHRLSPPSVPAFRFIISNRSSLPRYETLKHRHIQRVVCSI